ncbi:carboxyvinyl-carboxyphosphonate phosphorylmutase (plasmid) [Azospirillum baldaniorum]|uniref:Carboxyvinyl-carboxyphosphonate phosphorylmutase n=1 Tax=Azospirillum baldaniorum TaxID=1064539 RepID=A0A9P1JZA7_9PROT|nr:isocitrate lyase/PEP mutase family protein [Azospirillum baldaniorum]AWJ92797.1 carboxyvinyl-carboxyphosphonate phosphorylmutase [Azospirillum baldaniorum]NUB04968.1 isocitrate lyase/PEP mutase family protein [Azospirillum baldaniorum]TWA78213.1 2-methylisocitrate lyase-like PEP mutase family enzyme [Azospirillum brasilense]CCD02662.1 putative carboxyvinyl-carboxyphosphonate phosphorylmutase [Azospirillum baldaniorum]
MTTPAQRLKTALEAPGLHLMPCCFDALSARLIEQAGFRVSLMSGFAVSATRLGMPDTGLISFAEMLDQLRNVCQAAPGLLVIGDGDTGYGNAMNVQRTVRDYARAGAAAVLIEDQVSPKRCGHTKGKQVVGRAEARMKIRAAVDAARSGANDILILARTDARAVHGFDAALERCQDFVEEGADIIFMEAPHDETEMAAFCAGIDRPAMANMVRGGQTPMLPPRELEALGFKLAAYPLTLMSAAIDAMRAALAAVADGQESRVAQADFEALKSLVGFPDYYEREQAYRAAE